MNCRANGKERFSGLFQFFSTFWIYRTFRWIGSRPTAASGSASAIFAQQVVDGRIQRWFAEETRVASALLDWQGFYIPTVGKRAESTPRTYHRTGLTWVASCISVRIDFSDRWLWWLLLFYGTRTLRLTQRIIRHFRLVETKFMLSSWNK